MKKIKNIAQYFQGHISLEKTVSWVKPWRLNYQEADLHPKNLNARAEIASGARISFKTNSKNISLNIVPFDKDSNFDLTIDNKIIQTFELKKGSDSIEFTSLPKGHNNIEIWFYQYNEIKVKDIFIDDSAEIAKYDKKQIKWLSYGSSITNSASAHSPARTWPAIVARKLNLHLTSMGFGGQCHCDPLIGMTIRDHQDVDLITLKLGINIYGSSSLSERTYGPAIIGLIRLIREKHPKTTIGVISSVIAPGKETAQNAVWLSLKDMRVITEDAVQRLINAGDKNLYYFDGLEVFSEENAAKFMPDNVHPNGDGYEILGHNIADKIIQKLLQV